jgi:mannose-6-phosphate isomerase-like protein (cupin superfamily)
MPTRRVVTGNNKKGKSYFVHDGPTPGRLEAGYFTNEEIWIDNPEKTDPSSDIDPAKLDIFKLEPPGGGSIFRIFTFPPQTSIPSMTEEETVNAMSRFDTGDSMEADNPGMHTTKTIDYGIVLSGEITLGLDEGEVYLKSGDVVVQRGTRHAWRNTGSEPCIMAFVLIASPNYR